ncbi:MAG: endopeptidase La [Bacillota bacterium]|nr:endopeptidase La [Bacillota bacterium]
MKQGQLNIVTYPLLALRGIVVLPHMSAHFEVGRKKSISAIRAAMKDDQRIFLVTQRDIKTDDPGREDVYDIGTVAVIKQILNLPNDNVRILVEGLERASIETFYSGRNMTTVGLSILKEPSDELKYSETEAFIRETFGLFEQYASLIPRMSPDVLMNVMSIKSVGKLADYIAANIVLEAEDKQLILNAVDPVERIKTIITILYREIEILSLEGSIHKQVKDSIDKNQREYYLREQIKAIYNELGEGDNPQTEAENYAQKIKALKFKPEEEEMLLKEASKLSKMSSSSPESGVIRTYLDTVLELPWNKFTRDKINLEKVKTVLDKDHYGLEKVKERIIEYLAVMKLTNKPQGQILCLVGPPGIGKTSIATSIAKAINRKFVRMSLGGVRDEADIRGHRKTYIGSMPGRIIDAFKRAGSMNPLILFDEIDKMGNDFRGDPASAMLEVLDREQNNSFRDHYLEIPFDVSHALFITTANSLDTIPRPLLDRMEIIELTSYTDTQKLQIAVRHLITKQIKKHGLSKSDIDIDISAIERIITEYTRESGVRNLERAVEKICRKAAAAKLSGIKKSKISAINLEKYLGAPRIPIEKLAKSDEVGVANGLAWTSVGGEALKIEVAAVEGSGKIQLTGSLGDVMKESANAAITYIRSKSDILHVDKEFYKNRDIHIHVPEGAVPKDGPSAGITMATAIVSELTQTPIKRDVCMTGEITLRGNVLPIGGLNEKTSAAARLGFKTVILPEDNRADITEIDPEVRSKLDFIYVTNISQVLENALVPSADNNKGKILKPVKDSAVSEIISTDISSINRPVIKQ